MNTTESQLSLSAELAPIDPSPAQRVSLLLEHIGKQGITKDNAGALSEIVGLFERLQVKEAEKEYAKAFAALQAEMPSIEPTKIVPDKQGNQKFKFAPYEDIMRTVRPLLIKHGFSVTFTSDFKEGRIFQTCTLMHIGGCSRSNTFMARIGNGPPGASETQADGAASTYAKRFALCGALNIIIETDTDAMRDARNEGAPIKPDEAQYLRQLVKETGSDETRFLALAQADSYETIGSTKYDMLCALLLKKVRG